MKTNYENFINLYEVSKTLRFELKPIEKEEEVLNKINFKPELLNNSEKKDKLNKLVGNLNELYNVFLDTFIYKVEKDNSQYIKSLKFKNNIRIKYGWLRNYTKINFYEFIKSKKKDNLPKEYNLTEINYLENIFIDYLNEKIIKIKNNISNIIELPLESQQRRREIAFYIRSLKGRKIDFIMEFVNNIHNSNNPTLDEKIEKLTNIIKQLKELIYSLEFLYLPSQSSGIQLIKASFNYYTINKDSKFYDEKEKEKELNKKVSDFDKYGKPTFNFDIDLNFGENPLDWTLDEAYHKLKKFKSEQKNNFINNVKSLEFTQKDEEGKNIPYENLIRFYPLFETSEENFNEFVNLTKQIRKIGEEKNKLIQVEKKEKKEKKDPEVVKLDEKLKELAQKRGKFFNKPNEKIITKKYYELCKLYKKIATKRGEILAKIKGIEQEKVDYDKIKYWALIMENNNQKQLLLVPKLSNNNIFKAKKFIEDLENKKGDGDYIVYHFKSLTLRALQKLCFKKINNTFIGPIKKELIKKNANKKYFTKNKKGLILLKRLDELRKEENVLVEFYQDVLKTSAVKNFLDIVDFGGLDNVLNKEYKNLQQFEIDLEKICYVKKAIKLDKYLKDEFIKDFNLLVFNIDSYDLRIERENIIKNHENKKHTQIWHNFWSVKNMENNYSIRLNPEISISYRKANEELKKLGVKNRFSKNQFILNTTISINANSKNLDLSFKNIDTIKEKIDMFNKELNDKINDQNIWYYGIDRGLKELATLCIVRFKDEKYSINGKNINVPEFAKIKVYKLKNESLEKYIERRDGTRVKRKVIDNISYFINDENLFESYYTSFIDLTQAKLIQGKIVINGDKNTYLKLKELSAKRRLFELYSKSKIDKNSVFGGRKTIYITDKNGKQYTIYWLTKQQRQNQNIKDRLINTLREYLINLSTKNIYEDFETIEKINHLRYAITANMVGIIYYLQKQYPGKIALENMETTRKQKELYNNGEETGITEKMIDGHFAQSNEDISRRLEWSLYRKFQADGLVPPNIKQSIFLKDEFKQYQFGIIEFVKIKGTSSTCPYCEKEYNSKEKLEKEHIKNIEKIIDCDFEYNKIGHILEDIKNSDELAAYNVAKNGFKNIYQ